MQAPAEKGTRTCIGCGQHHDKREMMRIVRTADGAVVYDPTGRAAGRGAYVCSLGCLDSAAKTKKIQRALRTNLQEGDIERIVLDIVEAMR